MQLIYPVDNRKELMNHNAQKLYLCRMNHLIAPSILAADFGCLAQDVEMVNHSQADWLHVDVMDGRFVPNISFGFPVIKAINKVSTKPLDVHLMILEPEHYITRFRDVGAEILTVHYEACPNLHRTIYAIKEAGMQAGVALNPHTPVHLLEDILNDADLFLIMSVNPGYGGQKFIENTYSKIKSLRKMINTKGCNAKIEVDGGVTLQNASPLTHAGANVLVAGSTVFKSPDPAETISQLKLRMNDTKSQ
jgi:ribulose-phosphate 3-epimerase